MKLHLPEANSASSMDLACAIAMRETQREFSTLSLGLDQLSDLLWAGQGRRADSGKLNAPSAAGLYPMSLSVVSQRVTNLPTGLYHYENTDHSLERLHESSLVNELAAGAIGDQPWVAAAASIIVISAKIEMVKQHFFEQAPGGIRGERYAYIEAGAVAQNIHLMASALNISCVLVGGYDNEMVKNTLKLDYEFDPCALICLGIRN